LDFTFWIKALPVLIARFASQDSFNNG